MKACLTIYFGTILPPYLPSCTRSFLIFNYSVSHKLLVSFALNQKLLNLCGLRTQANKWPLTNQVGTFNPTDTALQIWFNSELTLYRWSFIFNFSVSHKLIVSFALNQKLILYGLRRQCPFFKLTTIFFLRVKIKKTSTRLYKLPKVS